MWQFAEAIRGLADGCLELGTPVTGGNVSLYNQTGEAAIHPTPVVAVLGVIDDVDPPHAGRLRRRRASCSTCSATPREEFGGSAWSAGRPRPPRRPAARRSTWSARSCSPRS